MTDPRLYSDSDLAIGWFRNLPANDFERTSSFNSLYVVVPWQRSCHFALGCEATAADRRNCIQSLTVALRRHGGPRRGTELGPSISVSIAARVDHRRRRYC